MDKEQTSGIVMFQDMTYGQWGLVLWSPDQALVRHQRYVADRFNEPGDLRPGDFIVGEFIGDLELVVVRCDPAMDGFGSVEIAQEIDPREEWPRVATSVGIFLREFLRSHFERFGEKYWESHLRE